MSRSGYTDECEGWGLIRWRGAVNAAIKGQRGQQLLRDLVTALDAMPHKELARDVLEENGEVCALGSVGQLRGLPIGEIDPEDSDSIATAFNIAPALAKEVMWENDESYYGETPEQRWKRMREWAVSNLKKVPASNPTVPPTA